MKTKRFPVSKYGKRGSEFLIPFTDGRTDGRTNGFRGIKSGKAFDRGMISFIGVEIDARDVLEKLQSNGHEIIDEAAEKATIEDFIAQPSIFKIGNVISV